MPRLVRLAATTTLANGLSNRPSSGLLVRGGFVGKQVETCSVSEASSRGWWRSWLRRTILYLLVPCLVLVLMLTWLQRSLMYFPTRVSTVSTSECGLDEGQVHQIQVASTGDVQLHGWLALARGQTADDRTAALAKLESDRPLLLYFPGNAGHRGFRAGSIAGLVDLGLHVVIVDYRGYAENAGTPTEALLHSDARSVQGWLESHGVTPRRLILFGESLGCAVAVRLAADMSRGGTPPGGLVLRAPFSSMTDTGAYNYPWLPVRWALVDRYESIDHIGSVTCPLTIVHGTEDQLIPIPLSRKLFRSASPRSASGVARRFVELPGVGHNGIPMEPLVEAVRDMMRTVDQSHGVDGHAK